jgi:hypothetical protein
MDEEAEKERVMRGTLRAQGITRSKTLRPQPTKQNSRTNSNFEYFMKQAQDSEPAKGMYLASNLKIKVDSLYLRT